MITIRQPERPVELAAYYDLRWRILRQPWNQPRGSERDEFEEIAEHVAALDIEGRVVGVGRLHADGEEDAQIRYMAVEEGVRGLGVGRAMVERLEAIAGERGWQRITLNSREGAVGFYEQLGYSVTGEGSTLFGTIVHLTMVKELS